MYTRQLPAGGSYAGTAPTAGSTFNGASSYNMSMPAAAIQPYAIAPAYVYRPIAPTNTLAIVGMILSIAAFSFAPAAIVGIILGHIARRQIRRSGERGDGMAVAALWIGYLLTLFWLLFLILYFGLIALAVGLEVSTAGQIS
ncbi:DUF4190 domain-containing protein [Brevibacterium sp. GP-SGM9]|uniref:DUF4190 domain-containing protein n=1 Tax=unclassified Brevibacterium TaxID=2614124 RepID=UPI001E5051A8|nr:MULTISPECIES: DUF4190 domain-containing protein [unclassified Brevibacterium]MCD1285582.1 hypothetical protein [Brevibacterium sp. CCUG 69071]MDK8434636.1 DUF4190 domain-containing protein [Brevibacterium sp. H-BE7]